MSTIRRTAVLIGLVAAIVIGSSVSASAAFSASTTAQRASVSTATITAPTDVKVTVSCGTSTTTAVVTWKLSTSAKVTGYEIKADVPGSPFTLSATAQQTSVSHTINMRGYGAELPVTVTTKTASGWTKSSPQVLVKTC